MGKLISETLGRRWLTIPLTSGDHEGAVRETLAALAVHPHVLDYPTLVEETWKREKDESTCIGNGIAFPHARCEAVDQLVIAAGIHPEGVQFAGVQAPIYLIFCIGTPQRLATEYLAAVGSLARLLKEEALRKKLIAAKNSEQFMYLIAAAEKEGG